MARGPLGVVQDFVRRIARPMGACGPSVARSWFAFDDDRCRV